MSVARPNGEQEARRLVFGAKLLLAGRRLDTRIALQMADGQPCLTRPGGALSVVPDHRAIVAALKSGIVFVAIGQRSHVAVSGLYNVATRIGLALEAQPYEVELEVLQQLNREDDGDGTQRDDVESLERQREIQGLLAEAAKQSASDIHIAVTQSGTVIKFRVNGRIRKHKVGDAEGGRALMRALLNSASDTSSRSAEQAFQQGGLGPASGRLPPSVDYVRLQYLPTTGQNGAMVARLKYRATSSGEDLDQLGYNQQQLTEIGIMRRRTNGMYVVAGKVSSGKTTTLQRNLTRMMIEKRGELSVYTIEEPVELDLPGAAQIGIADSGDAAERNARFAEAMRAALRSDPNVIVAGEVRDLETTNLAIKAALSGHALWTTTHAPDALRILDRLVDFGVEKWKVTDSTIVRGLIAQRLLGRLCLGCRRSFARAGADLDPVLATAVSEATGVPPDNLFVRGPGCDQCTSGLQGRTVAAETVLTDAKLLHFFHEDRRADMRRYWIEQLRGRPMMFHALVKVGLGLVDVNEVEEEIDLVDSFLRSEPALAKLLPGAISQEREGMQREPLRGAAE